jgi:pimeloyl-ACP methyl ester carboxylesterase
MHLVEDMVLILEREKIAGAPAVGHSMGVEVALELGHMRGDLVSGLVLACGGYERLLSTFQDTDLAVYLLPVFKFFEKNYPGAVRFAWQNLPISFSYKFALRFRQVNPILAKKQDLSLYLRHLRKVEPAVFISLLEEIQHHDTGRFFEDLRIPVLVVAGEHDTFTPPDLARAMADQIAGAELLVMRGATHIAPLEIPELFNLSVERFLLAHGWL